MPLRVLTWNLKHGRAVPSAGRNLFADFASTLAGWSWDLALLQEVPPWWPRQFGYAYALVLTSRNAGLALRRPIAERWPDAIKSNGGGCNAILARHARIVQRRTMRLRCLPERRWLHAVELEDGLWAGNLHASGRGTGEIRHAAETLREWAGERRAILGGDFNLRALTLDGFTSAGGHDVDHVFVRGLAAEQAPELLDRASLSDHVPVLVTVGVPDDALADPGQQVRPAAPRSL